MKEKNINEIYTFDRDYEAFPDIICLPPIPDEFKKKWGEKKKPFYATGKYGQKQVVHPSTTFFLYMFYSQGYLDIHEPQIDRTLRNNQFG